MNNAIRRLCRQAGLRKNQCRVGCAASDYFWAGLAQHMCRDSS
jgi:hypothetical protein